MVPETWDSIVFWDFRFCGMCVFRISFGTCSVIFFHALQKYRCVPKIGFSADISIDMFIDISIDNLIDILIDILTDKEEGGGRREGVDFFLRSNNSTPSAGEKAREILEQKAEKNNMFFMLPSFFLPPIKSETYFTVVAHCVTYWGIQNIIPAEYPNKMAKEYHLFELFFAFVFGYHFLNCV